MNASNPLVWLLPSDFFWEIRRLPLGLQLLMFVIRQLVGYRPEMAEQDIAAIMSMMAGPLPSLAHPPSQVPDALSEAGARG